MRVLTRRFRPFAYAAAAVLVAFTGRCISVNANAAPEQLYISSDSSPGWAPPVELRQSAERMIHDFYFAADVPAYLAAHGIRSGPPPLEERVETTRQIQADLGPIRSLDVIRVTWTKDSPRAPARGIYAAADVSGRFVKADRHCGYVVLYLAPASGEWQIARREDNLMSNEAAGRSPPDQTARIWAQMARRCPNYPGYEGPGGV